MTALRISVTDIDQWRYWQESEDMDLSELLKRLRRQGDATEAMAVGTALHRALELAEQAINDAISLYAPEFCHRATVKAAQKRMAEKGTIGYYADVLAVVRAARDRLGRKT